MSDRRSLIAWTALVVVALVVVAGAAVLEPVDREGTTGFVFMASIVFVAVFGLAGLLIFSRGLALIAESRQDRATGMDKPDIRGLIRGVRLMFLSVATFVAAVVAIVDVVETAMFLFVARTSSDRDDTPAS